MLYHELLEAAQQQPLRPLSEIMIVQQAFPRNSSLPVLD